jgi:hypothetical protein
MAKPSAPVEMLARQAPEATVQGENVVLTAPVAFADTPELHGQIRLTLSFEQADLLMARLVPAARIARQISEQKN